MCTHTNKGRIQTQARIHTHLNKCNKNIEYVIWFYTSESLVTNVYKLYLEMPLTGPGKNSSWKTNKLEKGHKQGTGIEIWNKLVKEKVKRKSSGDGNERHGLLVLVRQESTVRGSGLLGPVTCLPLKCCWYCSGWDSQHWVCAVGQQEGWGGLVSQSGAPNPQPGTAAFDLTWLASGLILPINKMGPV